MSEPVLHLIATITAYEGAEAQVEAALRALVEPTRAEPGCERYDLCFHCEAKDRFILVERWASHAAWRAHMATSHVNRFRETTAGLIADFQLEQLQARSN